MPLVCVSIKLILSFFSRICTVFNPQYKEALSKSVFSISLRWSAVARLFLISSMLFSLKEYADQGQEDEKEKRQKASEEQHSSRIPQDDLRLRQPQPYKIKGLRNLVLFVQLNFLVGIWALCGESFQ